LAGRSGFGQLGGGQSDKVVVRLSIAFGFEKVVEAWIELRSELHSEQF
jgi:hypothetical protein